MTQAYSACEVAQNNGRGGKPVWIIIKGVVYDLSDFLKNHPGGEETLLEYAGKDATKAFNQVGHSADAIKDMKLYKIGVVAPESTQIIGNADVRATTAEIPYRKQKRRIKLFFCF